MTECISRRIDRNKAFIDRFIGITCGAKYALCRANVDARILLKIRSFREDLMVCIKLGLECLGRYRLLRKLIYVS